jgi:hypothetical protein
MNPDPDTLDAETLAALNDKAKAAKLLNKIIAMLRADCVAGERATALHKLDRFFANSGDPHSFRVVPADKMSGWERSDHYEAVSQRQAVQIDDLTSKLGELARKLAEEQQQRSHADPDAVVPLTSLLSPDVIPEIEADEIQRRIRSLEARRFIRVSNITAEIDLPIGELMHALDVAYVREFGRRKKRGSNQPSKAEYLQQYGGKDASWCRKCLKAYMHTTSAYWEDVEWDGKGGIEGINTAAKVHLTAGKPPRNPRKKKWGDILETMAQAIENGDLDRAWCILQDFCKLAGVATFDEEPQQQAA